MGVDTAAAATPAHRRAGPTARCRRGRLGWLTIAVLLATAACSGREAPRAPEAAPTSTPSPSSAPTTPSPAPTPSTGPPAPGPTSIVLGPGPGPSIDPDADNVFTINFAEGKATGDTGRLKVTRGQSVLITVSSLRADEVHLHGYDLTAKVSVGRTATLRFDATIPGVFEIELEDLGVELAKLQVQ